MGEGTDWGALLIGDVLIAVGPIGGGSVNEGARRMYNLMNNLEARA